MNKEIKEVFRRAVRAIRVPEPGELYAPTVIRGTGKQGAPKTFTTRKGVIRTGRCPIA